jgi:hypothetical protein
MSALTAVVSVSIAVLSALMSSPKLSAGANAFTNHPSLVP